MENSQQQLETVFRSGSRKDCRERALVLRAAGIDHQVYASPGDYALVVAPSDRERAIRELEAYASENRDWHARPATFPHRSGGWGGVSIYAVLLLAVAILRHQNALGLDWLGAGRTHAGLIGSGQWWRTVTALCLHADVAHLAGNIVIGGMIGLFASQLLGSGLAWLSILLAGAAGNLLNAWLRQPGHTSIGASTAVFAAIGIVAAYSWQRKWDRQASGLARWTPLVGGVVLLSYLGTGGVRTDVTAHVTGFACGVGLGIIYGALGKRIVLSAKGQFLAATTALIVVALAWAVALSAYPAPTS